MTTNVINNPLPMTIVMNPEGSVRKTGPQAPEEKEPMGQPYHLNDLRVGQRFQSGTHVLDEEQIRGFALQFDPQPFHLDDEAARDTLFHGLAASGWHTAAITMRLQVAGGQPIAGGIVARSGELDWPRPTRPGDTLHVESEVVAITPSRSRPDRGTVVVQSETKNQKGEIVQTATMTLVVPRRAQAEAAALRELASTSSEAG
jgi:acyl dehydratase